MRGRGVGDVVTVGLVGAELVAGSMLLVVQIVVVEGSYKVVQGGVGSRAVLGYDSVGGNPAGPNVVEVGADSMAVPVASMLVGDEVGPLVD